MQQHTDATTAGAPRQVPKHARGEPDGPVESRKGQRERILKKLLDVAGAWVPASDLVAESLQYSSRIFELRHHENFQIENRVERRAGKKIGYFRLKQYVTVESGQLVTTPARTASDQRPETERGEIAPLLFPEMMHHRDDG